MTRAQTRLDHPCNNTWGTLHLEQSVSMEVDSEREWRQLDLMTDRLARFRKGELGIGPVIADLEALLGELQSVDESWTERFVEAWGDLEIPYAVALDRRQPIPTIADDTVAEGVAELERLVAEARAALGQ
jgi:hypothetical protein